MLKAVTLLAAAALLRPADADCYLHNPPGSNDRNRERNENRNNGNRLFDSQNNDKGGYPWRGDREVRNQPDPAVYYEGSRLEMEWTVQHSCGDNPTTHCDVIVQYACEDTLPGLRDGYPSGGLVAADQNNNNNNYNPPYLRASFQANGQNKDGTNRISKGTATNTEFGMHESLEWYEKMCQQRERNQGLFTADRILNGLDATKTRQNPNGNRNGFECPEERDYYPYWAPTPFRDLAVLTSNNEWCAYFKEKSQNVQDKWMCEGVTKGRAPIDQAGCQGKGTWTNKGNWGLDAPECHLHDTSRQNHLGNTDPQPGLDPALDTKDLGGGTAASWTMTLPKLQDLKASGPISGGSACGTAGCHCILRVRYNISTADYASVGAYTGSSTFTDSSKNCKGVTQGEKANVDDAATGKNEDKSCVTKLVSEDGKRPLYNRPYVSINSAEPAAPKVSIALNTDQSGRTFQDRTHVFKLMPRPNIGGANIWNVNTRGRRGNIVQAYPAVEYGFFPAELTVQSGEYIHFQWHGSDFNAPRNPNNAEGWQYSDRTNLIQTEDINMQFPVQWDDGSVSKFFGSYAQAKEFALLDTEQNLAAKGSSCEEFEAGDDNENNDPQNCGKMNYASARWQPSGPGSNAEGLVKAGGGSAGRGDYYFVSTRNNNFSNRSNKWMLRITGTSDWETAVIASTVSVVVVCPIIGFFVWAMYFKGLSFQDSIMIYCCCCLSGVVAADAVSKKGKKAKTKKKKKKKDANFDDISMGETQA